MPLLISPPVFERATKCTIAALQRSGAKNHPSKMMIKKPTKRIRMTLLVFIMCHVSVRNEKRKSPPPSEKRGEYRKDCT